MAARHAVLILGALCMGAVSACIQDDGTRFDPIEDITTVSEDEEREIGLQFDQQLRDQVEIIEDPVVAAFIHDLGHEIVQTLEPQPFVYRFRVIRADSLNAFAVPGGYIYFHSETLLAAGSLDELAGVMGHEIAHVKAHHYARMRKKSQIPDILAGVVGMAAAVASGRPEPLMAAQGANVALKLRWSREFETEADRYGSIFMARAGWQPAAITRFFERLVAMEKRQPHNIPPYLYSHPDVEQRIGSVKQQTTDLKPVGTPNPRLEDDFAEAQGRLAWMVDNGRASVPPPRPPEDPARIDLLLTRADDLAQERRFDEALLLLTRAESEEPNDPRVPFQIGEPTPTPRGPTVEPSGWTRLVRSSSTSSAWPTRPPGIVTVPCMHSSRPHAEPVPPATCASERTGRSRPCSSRCWSRRASRTPARARATAPLATSAESSRRAPCEWPGTRACHRATTTTASGSACAGPTRKAA
jgi:predicted Zn-dependent protease